MRERLASFISGSGSTMERIVDACRAGEIDMDIACVVSSSATAKGIQRAISHGINERDIVVIDPKGMRKDSGAGLLEQLKDRGVTVVTQNGWLPLTPELIIDAYPERIFNQHPGPVPEFGGKGMYGIRVHAAILLFAELTGRPILTEAVVQRVGKTFDSGVVVESERVSIVSGDTPELLQQRVLPVEHKLQLQLLQRVVSGTVTLASDRLPVVFPGEEQFLESAKQRALELYP